MPESNHSMIDEARLAHVGAHQRGMPAKLTLDPELYAFVEARLPRMTFAQIEAEVTMHFPLDRRISLNSIHRWWQKKQGGWV